MKTGLTEAQKGAINDQIVDDTATVTNANVKLLQTWYHAATKSNKLFANNMIMASLSTSAQSTAAATSTDTVTAGAIQGQDDFKTLYNQVMKTGLTEAQKSAINDQIVDNTATVTNANVKLLQTWYHGATKSNKLFANKMIIASLSTPAKTTAATTSTDTVTAKCPISTYAEFGSLYSTETAGKTWASINKIDSWVRGALPA